MKFTPHSLKDHYGSRQLSGAAILQALGQYSNLIYSCGTVIPACASRSQKQGKRERISHQPFFFFLRGVLHLLPRLACNSAVLAH